ncbi:MAG: PAS domain-containing protein [Desulfobacteraceae bacterium]|nr:MAG: PAS domain-containing protein [Desulfobacteraceae bacterium]
MAKLNLNNMDIDRILADMHEGVVISDKNGKVRFFNRTQARIDDIDPDDAVGKKITDIYQLDDASSSTMRCLATGKPILKEALVYRTRLGKVANVINNVYPIFRDGKLVGAINFSQDFHLLSQTMFREQERQHKGGRQSRSGNGTRFVFEDIIGDDPAVSQAIQTAQLSSDSPSPIMICGETGTGKEMFAQSIHNYSMRRKKWFIPVNCAAIPENLLEGILFGTSKGAFTGAVEKSGLFEQANGGTIFLDELDSMPIMLQAKLLRVIQERKVRRLGSLNEIDLDLKIISSVSRPPLDIVRENLLRMDLFYRMGVVFIMLPPLTDRQDTLKQLIRYFIDRYNLALKLKVQGISRRVEQLFLSYHWPGNVRELKHVIEAAMNMVAGQETIRSTHLPPHIFSSMERHTASVRSTITDYSKEPPVTPGGTHLKLSEHREASEVQMICSALEKTGGNAAKASGLLGVSPQALHYKLKKYRINARQFKFKARQIRAGSPGPV